YLLLINWIVCFLVFFFFQAEDGIRDLTVTGVQTCALPIFAGPYRRPPRTNLRALVGRRRRYGPAKAARASRMTRGGQANRGLARSEERRVGKECRSRWWPET